MGSLGFNDPVINFVTTGINIPTILRRCLWWRWLSVFFISHFLNSSECGLFSVCAALWLSVMVWLLPLVRLLPLGLVQLVPVL